MGVFFMRHGEARFLSCMYVLSLTLLVLFALHGLRDSVLVSGDAWTEHVVILDAGHGGPDGGSSAADGTRESEINLDITLKTDAVLGLLGERTLLTRETDSDLSSLDAKTIAQKKVTDIRNRVELVNSKPGAVLVSIHQNTYPADASVHGAQVFYGKVGDSQLLAEQLQENLRTWVDPDNSKAAKPVDPGVYLMNHIENRGVLVECGFLTNSAEAELLKTPDYQKRLAVAIAATVSAYLQSEESGV